MELAPKLLLTILFVAFFQNGNAATNPQQQMNALYLEMFFELSRQSALVFYARTEGEPWMPVLSKLEMGRHIYAKIDLLEGILAELQAKRDQMRAEREYFVDENTVEMFLNFVKEKEGAGHKAKLFSNFPREKFENKSFYDFVMNDEGEWWFMDELIGEKYPTEFFDILNRIMTMKLAPEETGHGIPIAYRPLQNALLEFIARLKLEIVVGQTHNDFENLLKGRIQKSITEIQQKIDEGPKGVLSKAMNSQKAKQKELFKKYKHLGEVSLELYDVLKTEIPELMDKKAKKEKAILSDKLVQLAFEVKKAFARVLEETFAFRSYESTHSNRGPTILEIQHQLCLPTQWLEKQKKLYASADKEAMLLSSIHMNAAMLVLAYGRAARFFINDD